MVACDATERERERACDGALRGRERERELVVCMCDERELVVCGVLREEYGEEF